MRVAIHANVVAAQVFDMLSHYALELSLNWAAVGVAIDLKSSAMIKV